MASAAEPSQGPDRATTHTGHPHRWRAVVAGALGVLAVFGVLSSAVAVWAQEVIFDTDTVTAAVDAALRDPAVTESLGVALSEQVTAAVPLEDMIDRPLPDSMSRLRPVLVNGAEDLITQSLIRLLREDRVRETVVQAAEIGHRRAVEVLKGGSLVDGARIDHDEVKVNLLPVLGRALEEVQRTGLLADVTIPEMTAAGDVDQQRAELGAALGRELPDGFGELAVYRSDAVADAGQLLERAQQAVALFQRSVLAVFAVTVVAAIASVAVARRRRRAFAALALGVVGAMAAAHGLIQLVVSEAPTIAADPGARQAIRIVVETLSRGLLGALKAILVGGAALAAGAYLSGPSGPFGARDGRSSMRVVRTSMRRRSDVVTGVIVIALAGFVMFVGLQPLPLILATGVAVTLLVLTWTGPREPVTPGR